MQPCCEDLKNRLILEQSEDRKKEMCGVCGRKHIEVTLDPGHYSFKGANI